jgi:putative transposase
MSSYNATLSQVIFATKYRAKALTKPNRNLLYAYIRSTAESMGCKVYIINGVEDHIHILMRLSPLVSMAHFVKTIKVSSNLFIKQKGIFPGFKEWGIGYGWFCYRNSELKVMYRYVENQEQHHMKVSSKDELRTMLVANNIEFDEKYLE